VTALCAAVREERAKGHVFNIAGGPTWHTTGGVYVKDYYDMLGVPIEEARFQERPGSFDWYDTKESQSVLHYQDTPKALIKFHAYGTDSRTALEEHLVEAAAYVQDQNGMCRLHFTILPRHRQDFQRLLYKASGPLLRQ